MTIEEQIAIDNWQVLQVLAKEWKTISPSAMKQIGENRCYFVRLEELAQALGFPEDFPKAWKAFFRIVDEGAINLIKQTGEEFEPPTYFFTVNEKEFERVLAKYDPEKKSEIINEADRAVLHAAFQKGEILVWKCLFCKQHLDDIDSIDKMERYLQKFREGSYKKCERYAHKNSFWVKDGRIGFVIQPISIDKCLKPKNGDS